LSYHFLAASFGYTQSEDIQFTSEEKKWIQENPVVYFGFDPGWKPIEFADENGQHTGIAADFLLLLEEKVGIDFQQHPEATTWTKSDELAKKGEVLFLPALAQNEARNEYLNFTQPFFSYSFVIITPKEGGDFIGSIEDLDHRKVAVPENYYISGLLEQEQVDMNFVFRESIEDCLMAVSTGEAEATVTNLTVASYHMNYDGYDNLKIAAPTHYPEIDIKIGVIKGQDELLSILEKGIASIPNKEKNEIVQNWVTVQYEHGIDMAKIWTIAAVSGGVVLLIFGSFVYWNRKLKREVSLRKEAEEQLRESFDEISEQKKIIEHKNEEVLDSIKYAKRLQEAILPPSALINEKIKKNFVLYLPKDIVAGDFYWMESVKSQDTGKEVNLIAAADCTGHGVPGAMVSVVCSNALNQSVLQHKLLDPGKILDKTTELVVDRFERSAEEVKDGMDIGLAAIEEKDNGSIVKFAGANNNIWVVSKRENIGLESNVMEQDGLFLHELKANKQPVGKYEHLQPFNTTVLELEKGERFFLYSDGYADQFGGPSGKKFKGKNFKKLILDTVNEPLSSQKEKLIQNFETWKGEMEQLDDVCVIGVEI
jgi:ABC-type amino acid transport substrate-binding protein/serine phosphatase RsbU (regulator of sigma subunit)